MVFNIILGIKETGSPEVTPISNAPIVMANPKCTFLVLNINIKMKAAKRPTASIIWDHVISLHTPY
jgi:hypothetical protein